MGIKKPGFSRRFITMSTLREETWFRLGAIAPLSLTGNVKIGKTAPKELSQVKYPL